jgi:polyhydroxyalkanoate synthase
LNSASPPWKTLSAADINSFTSERFSAFQRGLAKLARLPALREQPAPHSIIWQRGSARLLFYASANAAPGAAPLLLVPSLINTARIFDLSPETSLIRYLTAHGTPVYLLDWGKPGTAEAGFNSGDYVTERLLPALAELPTGTPPVLLGYCMGGLLAAAGAQLAGDAVSGLILMATPWDFSAAAPAGLRVYLQALEPMGTKMLDTPGQVPAELLQSLVLTLDPFGVVQKYIAFAGQADDEADKQFQRIEHWLADGVPLVNRVLREALFSWYLRNTPSEQHWQVAQTPISPARIVQPTLIIAPERDRIVPPAAALAFETPNSTVLQPLTGHIGMVAGRHSAARVWEPLRAWLAACETHVDEKY